MIIKAIFAGLLMVLLIIALPLGFVWLLKRRCSWLRRFLIFVATLLAIAQSLLCFADISGLQASFHYYQIRSFLNQPFQGWNSAGLNSEQGIISLSHLAEGLTSYGLRFPVAKPDVSASSEKAVELALSVAPFYDVYNPGEWGEENLYLSHLNVILGAYQRLTGKDSYLALNRLISEHLSQKMLAEPTRNLYSYGSYGHRWPADNTVTLYSLWLFDQNNQTQLSQSPIQAWQKYMDQQATDTKTRLHYSELVGIEAYSSYPRGCALSWSAHYTGLFSPKYGRRLWQRYRRRFKRAVLPFAALREYPVGAPLEEDYDSGPIMLGLGAAATGLALNGSKSVGDYLTYYQVVDSIKLFEALSVAAWAAGDPSYLRLATDMKAISISFQAEAYRPWW